MKIKQEIAATPDQEFTESIVADKIDDSQTWEQPSED
jgi:hypothetical protein